MSRCGSDVVGRPNTELVNERLILQGCRSGALLFRNGNKWGWAWLVARCCRRRGLLSRPLLRAGLSHMASHARTSWFETPRKSAAPHHERLWPRIRPHPEEHRFSDASRGMGHRAPIYPTRRTSDPNAIALPQAGRGGASSVRLWTNLISRALARRGTAPDVGCQRVDGRDIGVPGKHEVRAAADEGAEAKSERT